MTNPNQLCDVLLFVFSKMADETNLSSKLPVADRTREVWGRKLCWWCLSSGFPLCTFLLGFADSFYFILTSSPFYEASPLCTILCNLLPWLCWYVEVFKGGFEGVLVSLLLTTMGAFSYLKFSIEDFLWQIYIVLIKTEKVFEISVNIYFWAVWTIFLGTQKRVPPRKHSLLPIWFWPP